MPAFSRKLLDDPAQVVIPKIRYKTADDPLAVGDHVIAHAYNAGAEIECAAEILDTRTLEKEDGSTEFQYYVHYNERDRRLDEWIDISRIAKVVPLSFLRPRGRTSTMDSETVPLTRSQRRMQEEFSHKQKSYDDMDATTAELERQHEQRTKIKNVQRAVLGRYEMDVWYYSPYPVRFVDPQTDVLYICEYCLFYYVNLKKYIDHIETGCQRRQPPGHIIYRDGNLAVYEVFGSVYKLYCQCLCLLSKLFLDHKTLYYEVENFRFYVLCEVDSKGAHVVGHFSKEYGTNNNLACIMILPPYQRRGYGKLLIQLSYEISRREKRIGTPEKPLSDLGKVSYRSYWWYVLFKVLDDHDVDRNISVTELSELSGVHPEDIISTFSVVQMVKYYKLTKENMIRCSRSIINFCKTLPLYKPPKIVLDCKRLKWSTDQVIAQPTPREASVAHSDQAETEYSLSVDVDSVYDSDTRSMSTKDS